jgi:hypothetical protein
MSRLDMLEGAVVGASVAYFLDPDSGRARRRALFARIGRGVGSTLEAAVSEVERRAIARTGRAPRVIAVLRSGTGISGWVLRRRQTTLPDPWDFPMATVDIDIDQGIVTLHGSFPPVEEIPLEATPTEISRMSVVEDER